MTFRELAVKRSVKSRTHHIAKMAPNEAEPFRVLLRKMVENKGSLNRAAEFVGISDTKAKDIISGGIVTAPTGAKVLAAWKRLKAAP